MKFRDAYTIKGPLEAFFQPGSRATFQRGKEVCEGTVTIDRVDPKTNTIYFSSPLPSGIRPGDRIITKE